MRCLKPYLYYEFFQNKHLLRMVKIFKVTCVLTGISILYLYGWYILIKTISHTTFLPSAYALLNRPGQCSLCPGWFLFEFWLKITSTMHCIQYKQVQCWLGSESSFFEGSVSESSCAHVTTLTTPLSILSILVQCSPVSVVKSAALKRLNRGGASKQWIGTQRATYKCVCWCSYDTIINLAL